MFFDLCFMVPDNGVYSLKYTIIVILSLLMMYYFGIYSMLFTRRSRAGTCIQNTLSRCIRAAFDGSILLNQPLLRLLGGHVKRSGANF